MAVHVPALSADVAQSVRDFRGLIAHASNASIVYQQTGTEQTEAVDYCERFAEFIVTRAVMGTRTDLPRTDREALADSGSDAAVAVIRDYLNGEFTDRTLYDLDGVAYALAGVHQSDTVGEAWAGLHNAAAYRATH